MLETSVGSASDMKQILAAVAFLYVSVISQTYEVTVGETESDVEFMGDTLTERLTDNDGAWPLVDIPLQSMVEKVYNLADEMLRSIDHMG